MTKKNTNSDFVKAAEYALTMKNNLATGVDFDIEVIGKDGESYNLQVDQGSDRKALIQMLLQKIALWPAIEFEVRADDPKTKIITEIR